MKFVASLALAAAACALAAPASAQFAKPEDAVKYRKGVMTVMSAHFGRIGAMANGRAPYDPKAAVANAELVSELSKLPWPAFSQNTEKLSEGTKAAIWTEPAKFKEHNDKLMEQTSKLLVAARTENLDNLKTAFGQAAQACKSCHDNFRNAN